MIPVEPLSEEAFAPFGRVIDTPSNEPDAVGNLWRWWGDAGLLEDGQYAVGYLDVDPGRSGFDWAERHPDSDELVIPVCGELLVYVGEPYRVFRVRAGQAVILAKGVWHGAPMAADGPASAIVLLRARRGTEMIRFERMEVER
jgi:ureidoglycolate lyase